MGVRAGLDFDLTDGPRAVLAITCFLCSAYGRRLRRLGGASTNRKCMSASRLRFDHTGGAFMLKWLVMAVFASALITTPLAPVLAQAKTEKSDKASEKKLTPQQQKMKDCGAKWQAYKKEKNVKGRAEYRKFQSACLKG
jgi:hypothetical protein